MRRRGRREVLLLLAWGPSIEREIDRQRSKSIVDSQNRLSTTEIDRRQSILAVSPGSGRSVYWSVVGSVHIGRYSALPLGKGVAQRSGHQRLAFRGMTNALREMHQDDDKQARKNA
ncbi:hypothetical protein B296_00055229 [Ensete ventricosum]|uniref:Uncharacterized protein n=1 Tax=Ensete ventricosum TaxID=4639 RepID=A0A426Y155_ENSVE|nr:hypothetical protein B296_00055229 [Ensete ventricosum]